VSRRTSFIASFTFGVFWYVLSLWIADPSLDRIYAAYSEDFGIRFAALATYSLCSFAAGGAYMYIVLGIRSMWLKRKKGK